MQQQGLGQLCELNFRLEFHRARRAGFNTGITAGASRNLEIDRVMSAGISGSGDGFGRADVFADRTENAVIVDGWDRPVLLRLILRAGFER